MKKIIITGLVLLSLTGCGEVVSDTTEYRTYEITNIDPPKRMYVDLYDINSKRFFPREYVAKRCSNWEQVVSGSTTALQTRTLKYEDGTIRVHIDASSVCPR